MHVNIIFKRTGFFKLEKKWGSRLQYYRMNGVRKKYVSSNQRYAPCICLKRMPIICSQSHPFLFSIFQTLELKFCSAYGEDGAIGVSI